MSKQTMINNRTEFSMEDIYEYLAGYTTKLMGKLKVKTEFGKSIDYIIISSPGVPCKGHNESTFSFQNYTYCTKCGN